MANDTKLRFSQPVVTDGLPGFPAALFDVGHARETVEAARLPVVRSCPAWVEVNKRLILALASRSPAHVEAARLALALAVAGDRRTARQAWVIAA